MVITNRRAARHPGAFDHRFGGGTPTQHIESQRPGRGRAVTSATRCPEMVESI
jgi:hypothetical protein